MKLVLNEARPPVDLQASARRDTKSATSCKLTATQESLLRRQLKSNDRKLKLKQMRSQRLRKCTLQYHTHPGISEQIAKILRPKRMKAARSSGRLRGRLVRVKDRLDPTKSTGAVYKISCSCGCAESVSLGGLRTSG